MLQRRLVPSTSMLLAFDASARTGSFTLAAKELHLTQGAVSRQVAALENQLGINLFERERKSIRLTDVGKTYAKEVHSILQNLRNATLNVVSNPLNGVLNLGILPTFGTKWLMPQLPDFLQKHPDITINFTSKLTPFELKKENIHAAIHFGFPDWPDTEATYLIGEKVIPICSPTYFEKTVLKSPADFSKATLLHLASRPNAWDDWFTSHGEKYVEQPSVLFEQFSTVIQAALVGIGVALLPEFLITNELEREELIRLLPDKQAPSLSPEGPAYYLISPTSTESYAPLKAFRHWITEIINNND